MNKIPYKMKTVVTNKWKDKETKQLLEFVRDRYLLLRKLRVNIMKINPNKQKRKRKRREKP
jgi:hypothetical protein